MNSKKALELAIFEYEKDLEYDDDNQWVINVLKGLKEVKQDLEKLEKENQELKNTILSLELDTCIPELKKENQELKEKATPKKPIAHHYEEVGEKPYIKYSCPKCHNKHQLMKNIGNYCPYCGQRLDWGDVDDK